MEGEMDRIQQILKQTRKQLRQEQEGGARVKKQLEVLLEEHGALQTQVASQVSARVLGILGLLGLLGLSWLF